MNSATRSKTVAWAVALCLTAPVLAQFPSPMVLFNSTPIDDPATAKEMFQVPEFSPTTASFIVPNSAGLFDNDAAFRQSSLLIEGAASLEVFYSWVSATDNDAWVRLTTANGNLLPNPALDTQGKVRFSIINKSQLFTGAIGVCLGIRETGNDVPQLADGGTAGDIEWVGVDTTVNAIIAGSNGLVETTAAGDDVQQIAVGSSGLSPQAVVISPGVNGTIESVATGDDVARFGYSIGSNGERVPIPAITLTPSPATVSLEWDLSTGVVSVNGTPSGGGITGFTGNGVLDALNNRGVLEHIALTNVATDPATGIDVAIDQLQFEATVHDPVIPPVIQSPVFSNDTQVLVDTSADATEARLFINGTNGPPVTPVAQVATFTGLALSEGDVLTATQSAFGTTSGFSAPVTVVAQGLLLVEDFDSYATQADLNAVWSDSIANPSTKITLVAGNASSCDNFVQEDNPSPTNFNEGRLYRFFGSVNGTDAEPLRVTWRFRHDGTSTNLRTRFELARFSNGQWSAGPRAQGTTGFSMTNQIAGSYLTQYSISLLTSDPQTTEANGFTADANSGHQTAVTGVTRVPNVWHQFEIEVKSTVINYFIDGVNVNPVAFPAGVPRPDPGPYQFVILGIGLSNNGSKMMWDDIAVTKGAAVPPFIAPAPDAPSIASALTPLDTSVPLSNVSTNATQVVVLENGTQVGVVNTTGFTNTTVTVTTSPLTDGALVTARQTIGGVDSCNSTAVLVGAVPGAPTVNQPLEAGDTTVSVSNIDLSATLVSVFANSNSLIGTIDPLGAAAVAVPVTPLVHLDQITASATNATGQGPQSTALEVGRGNGDVLIALGVRETGGAGPLGANGGFTGGIEWIGADATSSGAPQGKSLTPTNGWQTVTFDPTVDPIHGFAGAGANGIIDTVWGTLEHLAVSVDAASGNRSVGSYKMFVDNIVNVGEGTLTDFEAFAIGGGGLFRTPSFSGSTAGHLLTPPNVSQVSNEQGNPGNAQEFQFYFADSGENRWVRLTSFNAADLPNPLIRLDIPTQMDILLLEVFPPDPPTLVSPIQQGDTTVTVDNITSNATLVEVLANGSVIGSVNPMGTTNGLAVPVTPLVHLDSITARQTNVNGTSGPSTPLEVGRGNGDILVSLLIRESGDTGPIGSNGTATGQFEFIGANTTGAGGAPLGIAISPTNGWQTVTFDPATVVAFGGLGDGVITQTRGIIGALAVTVDSASANRSAGVYRMFIDNIVNVGAGTVTDFEGFPLDSEVVFQEPTFSGSTDANLAFPPSASANSDDFNNGGVRSQLLTWVFKDTGAARWVRIATSEGGAINKPDPIIDLTAAVQMDVLLLAGCPTVLGDMDGDCDIGQDDFAMFEACLLGVSDSSGPQCVCADFTDNGRVDLGDYAGFQQSFSNGFAIPGCTPGP